MRLYEAFDLLNITLDQTQKDEIASWDGKTYNHHGFGMSIRNLCHMWRDGTDDLVKDILALPVTAEFASSSDGIRYRLPGEDPMIDGVDWSLKHPDNCCYVMLKIYGAYLRGEVKLFRG